jgi:hypothetical protein
MLSKLLAVKTYLDLIVNIDLNSAGNFRNKVRDQDHEC